ncbi:Methylated-DNA--protein-cysteine methyltransferase, constitutive [anaerobic digester metagenome]
MYYTKPYNSPIGPLYLTSSEKAITKLSFQGSGAGPEADHPLLDLAFQQLDEYFAGTRKAFTLPLAIEGTRFQKLVYAALQNIGYAKTASYAEIACAIGNPKACRAVGMANNRNRLALLVPCHRVIGTNGSLTGYEGGLEKKAWLLDFERSHS